VTTIIQTTDLGRTYPGEDTPVHALRNLDLSVEAGEWIAVTGPSGSGKSTLLHLLGGLDRATTGEVVLDGQILSGLSRHQLAEVRNRRVGFVFQLFNLLPGLTVEENVALPALIAGEHPSSYRSRLEALLEKVGLKAKRSRFPAQLSGGEQQRVAIARALINHPLVILADEPTGNLDTEAGQQIMAVLADCHASGQTIVLVTHDLRLASQAGRVIFLRDGCMVDEAQVAPGSTPGRVVQLDPGDFDPADV
jgi:putative ABC transport system ATP-binding protein